MTNPTPDSKKVKCSGCGECTAKYSTGDECVNSGNQCSCHSIIGQQIKENLESMKNGLVFQLPVEKHDCLEDIYGNCYRCGKSMLSIPSHPATAPVEGWEKRFDKEFDGIIINDDINPAYIQNIRGDEEDEMYSLDSYLDNIKSFISRLLASERTRIGEEVEGEIMKEVKRIEEKACLLADYSEYDEVNMSKHLQTFVRYVVQNLCDTRKNLLSLLSDAKKKIL